jgi:amidase
MFAAFVARDAERWSAILGRGVVDELEPMNATLAELGRGVVATQWLTALEAAHAWVRRMAAVWEHHDLLLLPVTPEPPMRLGELAPDAGDTLALLANQTRMLSFTIPFNVSGDPAISLPLHWTADGLPVGIQLVAPMGREDLLFRIAGQLERARPWADRRPRIAAT